MPRGWTSRSRRDCRSSRSEHEDSDTQRSGYSHQDSRNPQNEGNARSRTNRDGYYPGGETYSPGSDDQDDYGRDVSRDGDGEFSESDTARRSSEWGMVPYQDPTIRATPSVASDSTLVIEAPAVDTGAQSNCRRRYRPHSRDHYYAYDVESVSNSSGPFRAEQSYTSSPERYSHRTNNSSRQSSQGYQHARSTRHHQSEEDYSYPAGHSSYERNDYSQMSYRTSRYMDEECLYYSDEEPQNASSGTPRVEIWPGSVPESVEYRSPSHELPGGSITLHLKRVILR
ncbi:hypothetical protein F5144DRAFT_491914 [Chaetomium tenue]|uniref:Uncharacterized protein n=1 Tax=Chaetomium tenue TaxID=1854479 RepID=A0ACB7P6F0_9PEZI|nr:hypothetical protein F5144DRAFT_491914 [Chaetomium globosum]